MAACIPAAAEAETNTAVRTSAAGPGILTTACTRYEPGSDLPGMAAADARHGIGCSESRGNRDCGEYTVQAKGGGTVLWTILAILLVLWLLGFGFHIGGSLIHLLLIVAAIVLVVQLVTGRRAV